VALDDLDSAINIATGEVTQANDDPLSRLDSAIDDVTTTQKKRAATVTSIATKFNPDQIAQSRNLGRKVGLPDAVSERNPEEVRRKFISQQVESLYDTSPVTGRNLSNPEFAKLTHDITDELRGNEDAIKQLALTKKGFREASELSRAMSEQSFSETISRAQNRPYERSIGDVTGSFAKSVAAGLLPRAGQGIYGALASPFGTLAPLLDPLVGTVLPANPLRVAEQGLLGLSENQSNVAESIVGDTSDQGFVEKAVNSGFESLGMNLPPLIAGIYSGNSSLALNAMVGIAGGQEYAKARASGLDANQALVYAGSQAAVEWATEKIPVETLFKGLRGEAGLLKTVLLSNVQEQIGEQAATVLQDLNEWAALNPEKPFSEYLAERPDAALQTAIATFVGTTGQVAIAKSIEAAGNFVSTEQEKLQYQSEAANQSMQAFANIQQLAAQSKLKERSAQDFATFLQEAGGENGIDEVYIDARTFMQEAQNLGVDVNTLMQSSPVIQKQLEEAIAQGIDLVIPVGEFGATIAGTELGGSVLQHLRADENGISAFEAKTQLDTAVEELQKQAENVAQQYQDNEAWTQSLTEVSDNLLGQLNTLGRFTPDNNQAYVSGLVAPWYSTLASNLGITPSEAFARYPLKVSGQVTAEGFEQGDIAFNDTMIDYYDGQSNMRLLANVGGKNVAGIDYTVYQGKPKISMIEVADDQRRKGYATSLLKQLQRQFPNTEIDFGMLTGDGDSLYKSLKFNDIPRQDIIDKQNQIKELELRLNEFEKINAEFDKLENPTDGQRDSFINATLEWNDVRDNLDDLRNEIEGESPVTRLIDTEENNLNQSISQTDTPQFKAWFGDSKVVDADGKPLVVYHGTNSSFSEFRADKTSASSGNRGFLGAGFYMSKSFEVANAYADEDSGNVMSLFVSMQNPLGIEEKLSAKAAEAINRSLSIDTFEEGMSIEAVRGGLSYAVSSDPEVADTLTQGLEQQGYDGVLFGEMREIVAFYPNQIKSAIGNRGTFDPNDANILNQDSNNYDSKEFKNWFKKSKVVDKQGKPLTMYHGTDAIFNVFDYTKIGTQGVSEGAGFYFTNSQDVAKGYGSPLEVNLSIQKPLAYDAKPFTRSVLQRLIKRVAEIESVETGMGIGDGFLSNYGDINYEGFNSVLRDATESMVNEEAALDQISSIINSGVSIETVNKAVTEVTGYDGVVSKGFSNEGSEDNTIYVAFFPEQVKSTSNNGAYDPVNRDIYNQQARGQISFSNDITQGANITLLKNADASTFIHELGHFFLEVYADVASKPDAPQVIVDDMNQLFNWFGIESTEQPALDVWRNMTIDQKRFYHEKLARGFEQYAMEGTAPTLELSRVFAKLRSFMLSAYKSLKQFFERSGEPGLTNEVRQVFDRMLASDEAINKAEAVRGMMPMFASMEEAGMSIDEYAEYLQNQQDATDEAKTALTARSLRDMKWLHGARSRVLKDLQRQADTERRMVRMAVRREVMTQPVYQAYSWLKQIPDETKAQQAEKVKATKGVDVEKDSLYTAIAKLGGLNRQLAASEWGLDPKDRFDSGVFGKPVLRKDGGLSVDEMAEALSQYEYLTKDENGKWDLREFEDKFFEEARGEKQYSLFAEGEQYRKWQESIYDEQERVRLDAFGKGKLDLNMMRGMYGEEGEWRNLGVGRSGMVMELGNPPDAVAELFGFNSGDQLVKSLLAAENPKSLIDRLTDERMLAEFGDLVDAKKMNEAADKAVHNEVRARVLATELSAQNKALGNRRILEAAAKEYAQQKIAQKTVKDIKPYIYTRAEEKSAKLAEKSMRQGDTNTVVQAKRDQLLNNRIAKEAFAALDEIEKYIDKVRKLNKSSVQGNMRGEPLVQMLAVLERFDFRTGVSNAQLAEIRGKEPLAQWVEKEAERLVAVIPNLPDFVLDETYRKSYKDMTLAELRDLMGAVTQLEQLARRENKQYKEIRNQTFQEEKATILEQIKKTYPQLFDAEGKVKADIPSLVVKLEDKIADSKDGMLSGYLNITAMAEILDGGQTNGTVFESLFGRYSEASNYKSNRLSEIYAELKPYLKDQYSLAERRAFSRRDIGTNTVGISLTRENAVVAVALYGSEEGRQRLSNWFDAGQMQQIIDLLDQRDIELVKTLWRVSDEMIWPELESVNNRTKGISPPKVKGVAFDTKFGTLEGGYFHLDYRSADNPEKGVQVQTFDASKSLDELRAGIGMSRATRQGTSKERVTQSNLRPNLHLDVFSSAVNETLHDIAFREALADTMRLLNDNQVALALKKSLGEKHYKAITQRISEIAIPQYNPTGMMEKAFSIARKNTVAVLLSGMTTALQNFTGLSPALTKVKPALVLKNLAKFYSPSMSKNINFAIENSPYMKSRLMNGYDRDVQGMIKEFTVNSNITPDTKYALFLMGLVDVGVSFPVWNAAFEQNMTETKNDVEASVKFADAVIQTTMGSGRDVDQSTMVSGKGAMNAFKQMFLMFFNYFQAQGQRLVVAGAISKQQWNSGNRANAVANFTVKYIFIVALPAIITEFLFGWGDDDDEEYMKRSIESVVFFQTAMIPLVRDVARPVWNQFDEDVRSFGYKMSPVESAIQMAIQTPGSIQDLWEGSGDDRDIKRVIMGAGFLTGMPGKLISDVTLGTKAYMEGEAGPQAIIVGPPRD
jgi:hypothetical protein